VPLHPAAPVAAAIARAAIRPERMPKYRVPAGIFEASWVHG
jgi:hypothetical protein